MKIRYATLALCLIAIPAWADMYKWVDSQGKSHYSDQPPPPTTKRVETIKQSRPPADAESDDGGAPANGGKPDNAQKPDAKEKNTADEEMEFRRRKLQQVEQEAKAQKDAQAAEERKRNCQRSTDQYSALQRGGRITKYGPNGEQLYLSDAEIAQELATAKKAMDSWCK
ncbi:MAG: DUF4124 domain-containing protein [Betaproteobacteria bacterium]